MCEKRYDGEDREFIVKCEEGRQLLRAYSDARTCYLNYIGNDTTSQTLYDTYDTARVAYRNHIDGPATGQAIA